ncbi:hypothetical protein CBW16_09910 [Flavobacteriaceae bacterium JJC]|nr:hypothetical protein CBW16_09910 [Flavobacteriaceae bacterium JJC]
MKYKLFRYKSIYFVAILYSLFGSGLFGYIVVSKITIINHIGFVNDDFIYFPLSIISFISFFVSFFLLLKMKLFSVTTLNGGITSFVILIILGLIKSWYYREIKFKFIFPLIIFLLVNVILIILINKFKMSDQSKVFPNEIDEIGKPE